MDESTPRPPQPPSSPPDAPAAPLLEYRRLAYLPRGPQVGPAAGRFAGGYFGGYAAAVLFVPGMVTQEPLGLCLAGVFLSGICAATVAAVAWAWQRVGRVRLVERRPVVSVIAGIASVAALVGVRTFMWYFIAVDPSATVMLVLVFLPPAVAVPVAFEADPLPAA